MDCLSDCMCDWYKSHAVGLCYLPMVTSRDHAVPQISLVYLGERQYAVDERGKIFTGSLCRGTSKKKERKKERKESAAKQGLGSNSRVLINCTNM